MEKIKIGVIGCASVAERHVIPAIKAMREYELVAVSSRTKKKAELFASKFSCEAIAEYSNLLNRDDISVVYIPLPTALHEEWILKAMRRGKHVLSEKSLTTDYASAKKIIGEAKRRKLLVMEDFMFQYHSQHAFVKKLISKGEIGDVHFFHSAFGFPPRSKDDIRYSRKLGGGALLDAGGYVVKAAQLILEPDLVHEGSTLHYDNKRGIDIYGGAILKNKSGQIAHLSFSFNNYYQCLYEVWGSKGKITVNRAFTPPPNFSPTIMLEKQGHTQEFVLHPDNHFTKILKEFYRSVREEDFEQHWSEALIQSRLLDLIRKNGE